MTLRLNRRSAVELQIAIRAPEPLQVASPVFRVYDPRQTNKLLWSRTMDDHYDAEACCHLFIVNVRAGEAGVPPGTYRAAVTDQGVTLYRDVVVAE